MKIKPIFAITAMAFLASLQVSARETLAEATKGKFLFGLAVNAQQVNGVNPVESNLIAHGIIVSVRSKLPPNGYE